MQGPVSPQHHLKENLSMMCLTNFPLYAVFLCKKLLEDDRLQARIFSKNTVTHRRTRLSHTEGLGSLPGYSYATSLINNQPVTEKRRKGLD